MTAAGSIARLKITLDDVEPAVMRLLEIPLDLRLDRLHLVLQAAMGWTNTHLYEFRIRDIGWGIPDPEWDFGSGPLDARKATLLKVLQDTGAKTLKYLYDFGDRWEHTVRIERISPPDPEAAYPILIDAVGRCPPEDVGGPPGLCCTKSAKLLIIKEIPSMFQVCDCEQNQLLTDICATMPPLPQRHRAPGEALRHVHQDDRQEGRRRGQRRMMTPLESIEANPPNVWLKYFDGFDPGIWGHVGFTYEPHRARLVKASEPGVLIVIAATSRATLNERGRILGILQCSHETGSAETYSEPQAFATEAAVQSPDRWSHAVRAVRAWRFLRHHRMPIGDFAPTTYTPARAQIIGSAGMRVTAAEAHRILNLDLEEVDVFAQPPVGMTAPGSASEVLTPSRPGPVSQRSSELPEAEGPKHLYVLALSGKAGVFLNDPTAGGRIVKVGFSGAPEDRLDAHNRHIPMGQFRWGLHRSTEAEGRAPFPTSAHGLSGEAVMIRTLHADGRSLGGEFFLAEDAVIDAAWQAGLDAGATA